MTPEVFQKRANVSRETLERLKLYAAALEKWQKQINLVGPQTIQDLWARHFWDSAQLVDIMRRSVVSGERPSVLDMGSGAGFPGLVLAIMTGWLVTLAESNGKKCAFLRHVAHEVGVSDSVVVRQGRLEEGPFFEARFITARALAKITDLLALGQNFAGQNTEYFLLKGQYVEEELREASIYWKMKVEKFSSLSDPRGAVIHLSKVMPHERQF